MVSGLLGYSNVTTLQICKFFAKVAWVYSNAANFKSQKFFPIFLMFIGQKIGSIVPSTKKRMRGGKKYEERGTRPTFETGVITSVHCGYNGSGNLRYLNKLLRIKYNAKMHFIPLCFKI